MSYTCGVHDDPGRGGGGTHLGKARVVPRCPGVFSGRSRGDRHLGPVGRMALPEVAARQGKKKKCPFFNDFLVFFWLIFAFLLVILPGLVRFF